MRFIIEQEKLWVCPDCAFGFNVIHEDVNGGYSCPACAEIKLEKQVEELRKALGKAGKFISAIMEFHGQNLQVANWHLNGDLEPWDNFFEENMDGDELEVIRQALERKVESA